MFDSLVLRIKDLDQHAALYNYLDRAELGKGISVIKYYEDVADAEKMHSVARLKKVRAIHKDHDQKYSRVSGYGGKLTSSHYDLRYFINEERDYIEFNFSIPKYLFGTNIFQTFPTSLDPKFQDLFRVCKLGDIPKFYDKFYSFLMNFLNQFFKKEFGDHRIYYDLVEVRRLDFCYNMFFSSYNDALDYINHAPKVAKKYTSKDKTNAYGFEEKLAMEQRNTGFAWQGKNYHQKMYHKGSEFKAQIDGKPSNRAKLKEKNIEWFIAKGFTEKEARSGSSGFLRKKFIDANGYPSVKVYQGLYDIEHLQAVADRIVRFEMSFTNKAFNDFFKKGTGRPGKAFYNRPLFRKNCDVWQGFMKLYREIQNKEVKQKQQEASHNERLKNEISWASANNMVGKIDSLNDEHAMTVKELEKWKDDYSKKQWAIHFHVKKVVERYNNFYLAVGGDAEEYNTYNRYDPVQAKKKNFEHIYESLFSVSLVKMCLEKFVSFVQEFEIQDRAHINHVLKLVDANNIDIEKDKKAIKHLRDMGIVDLPEVRSAKRKTTIEKYIRKMEEHDWSMSSLKADKTLPKSTRHDMINELRKYGLDKGLRNDDSKFVINFSPGPYYVDMMLNKRKLKSYFNPVLRVRFQRKEAKKIEF